MTETTTTNWESMRERWTVISAIVFLAIIFLIILVVTIGGAPTITESLSKSFNPILMAILGYLFAYVPTKASESSAKKDVKTADKQIEEMAKAIEAYRAETAKNRDIIQKYALVVSKLKP